MAESSEGMRGAKARAKRVCEDEEQQALLCAKREKGSGELPQLVGVEAAPDKGKALSEEEEEEEDEDEEEDTVTMLDVLEEERELEKDAEAVLGASDDQNCTYSQGYVLRQALYACVTCLPPEEEERDGKPQTKSPAGICLACSFHCHEGHRLVELYTKRRFRCDCGNSRFPPGSRCNLEPNKSAENEKNHYNQNFRGVYCTCARPYPDPEDETPDEMIQCVVCEDWYHARHLGTAVPPEDDFEEVVCGPCMDRNPFLWAYSSLLEGSKQPKEEEVDVEKEGKEECPLKKFIPEKKVGATFWPQGWRQHLCSCTSCLAMYEERGLGFIRDERDTVQAYEESGKLRPEGSSHYERGLQALSSMDRVQQVEAIQGYNDLREELKTYLQRFADKREVVREEDIRNFFSDLKARRRQRTPVSIPFFCR